MYCVFVAILNIIIKRKGMRSSSSAEIASIHDQTI